VKDFSRNKYERAFENWLIDNRVQYMAIDEHKRAAFARNRIKTFDFLLYPRSEQIIIAEVKGRRFKGTSFARLTALECWVTAEDVDSLARWQEVLGPGHDAIFVFAYDVEKIDVDFDGREVFDFNAGRYLFFAVRREDYRRFMKLRSPKWQTVALPADKFRQCAIQVSKLLL